MIRLINGSWFLFTSNGDRKLGGPYKNREGAVKRERQVQYFKHVKKASLKNELSKLAMAIDFSGHFWDRVYGRQKVKNSLANLEYALKNIGDKDTYLEDIPELKHLVSFKKNNRFIYQESPTSAKYIFDIKEAPNGKHEFVAVTGLNPEYLTYKTEDITRLINLLLAKHS